jgi:Peptidase family M1 domain/Peptidase M1 N-terminal domain/Immune inhibitor A-like, MAM domain
MRKLAAAVAVTAMVMIGLPIHAGAGSGDDGHPGGGGGRTFTPGSPGIGDEYFPLDGNGGYDVGHYDLDLRYDPATGVLAGEARITATATQDLSSFDLDLQGLQVHSVTVDGRLASFTRDGSELVVTPARGLRRRTSFVTEVRYDGVPEPVTDPFGGTSGFIASDDGALIAGQPDVAATWFPVNDHPIDAASYSFHITVPAGTEVVANGVLVGSRTARGWTTWHWEARSPMASYLATASIGQFLVHAYRSGGIRYWDAIDPDLFTPPLTPHSGTQLAFSQAADLSYKRLTHTITVPAGGATMSFWVSRSTEPLWDHFFVEAHTPGADDWRTLPETSGITSNDVGRSCPFWLTIHPFLGHYQTDNGDGTCAPSGTTGSWNAVSGDARAWTQWTVALGGYAGGSVEVSLSYASDDIVQHDGVGIDDIVVSTGEGSTSFEDDGDTLDGWTVPGAPDGSPGNRNDWIATDQPTLQPSVGQIASDALARQPEILDFLAGYFGKYPFEAAGGIVDDAPLGFALENQTRPIYSAVFFTDPISADSVVVHELTHQWFGDDLRLGRWRDIWLNEGFATYAEWLWAEREGLGTPQDNFDFFADVFPADDPFWALTIGDPGPVQLFDPPVYYRGAMTLHALRLRVGDDTFFRILRSWAKRQSGNAVSTDEFIDLAESISHQQLDDLFDEWLYTPARPASLGLAPAARTAPSAAESSALPTIRSAPAVITAELRRWPLTTG